jgi:hypothetical protein
VMRTGLRLAAVAVLIGGPAAAQPRPTAEEIGSWVLSCPADAKYDACTLRHRTSILPPMGGGPTAALEIQHRGNQYVPVVAVRGLSMQAALGSVLAVQATVSLRFDNAPRTELSCGLDGAAVVCAPAADAAASAAGQLSSARSVLVEAQLSLPGGMTLPEQSRTLELQRTADAVVRLRAIAFASDVAPALPGLEWRGYADRLLRAIGLEHPAE